MTLEQGMLFVAPWNTGVRLYFIDGFTRNGDPKVTNFCRATQQWTKTTKTVTNPRFFDNVTFVDRKTARDFMARGTRALNNGNR
jgi:hypothetical protein